MADTRQSLFGPSPEEVAAAQAAQGQEDAFNWAKIPAGRGMVAAAATAGQALGGLGGKLMGGQDPAQARAMALQQAQQDTEMRAQAMGINLANNPQDYYKLAADTLHKYGMIDEAQNVMNIAQGHDLAEREMKVKEAGNAAQMLAARAAYLKAGADKTSNKSILTLVPPGTDQKSGKQAETYNLSDPEQAAVAKQRMQSGWVDLSKLASPPSPGATVNVLPNAPKSFAQQFGEEAGKEQYGLRTAARDAHYAVPQAQSLIAALDDPNLIVGPGADARLLLAKALNIAGADNGESITNTQSLISQMAETTLGAIKSSGLGTSQGFTDKDREFLQDAKVGRIPMTKEAIRNVAILNMRASRATIQKWNDQLNDYDENTKKQLRSVGVSTDPLELPEIPRAKKYQTKAQRDNGVPAGIDPETWKYMPEDKKALFRK